jgi:hypothetical protein
LTWDFVDLAEIATQSLAAVAEEAGTIRQALYRR